MTSSQQTASTGPIGVFDSGYGGLTILKALREHLPQYDFLYLGDNARAPYGTRSFEVVCEYTWQAVRHLFAEGAHLVVLACNTASAKALRTIQQELLPVYAPEKRVLGVIRPTVEAIAEQEHCQHVGLLATPGTVQSDSYRLELEKLCPHITLSSTACPMWVSLIENGEKETPGAVYFIERDLRNLLAQDSQMDTLILGCTHFPLVSGTIRQFLPQGIRIVNQGEEVSKKLQDYLHRHPEHEQHCSKGGSCRFLTTEQPERFSRSATLFIGHQVQAAHIVLK